MYFLEGTNVCTFGMRLEVWFWTKSTILRFSRPKHLPQAWRRKNCHFLVLFTEQNIRLSSLFTFSRLHCLQKLVIIILGSSSSWYRLITSVDDIKQNELCLVTPTFLTNDSLLWKSQHHVLTRERAKVVNRFKCTPIYCMHNLNACDFFHFSVPMAIKS